MKTTESRDCFTFFASFYTAISELPDNQQLAMYRAVAEYALFGADPQLNGVPNALFSLMRPNIDSSNKKRDAGKKGGLLGGAPIGNQNAVKHKSKNKAETKQNQANIEIEVEKETENEIEREKEKKKDIEKGAQGETLKGTVPDSISQSEAFLSRHSGSDTDQKFIQLCAERMRDHEQASKST